MSDLSTYEVIVVAVLLPLALALFGFWIWMFVDALRNENFSRKDKRFWAIVLLLFRPVGALLYYFKEYRRSGHKAT